MTVNLAGFIAATVIARESNLGQDEAVRLGVISAMFPNPLLGVVIAKSLADKEETEPGVGTVEFEVTVPPQQIEELIFLTGTVRVPGTDEDQELRPVGLLRKDPTHWTIQLPLPPSAVLTYNYARGAPEVLEADAEGQQRPPRSLELPAAGESKKQRDAVKGWTVAVDNPGE